VFNNYLNVAVVIKFESKTSACACVNNRESSVNINSIVGIKIIPVVSARLYFPHRTFQPQLPIINLDRMTTSLSTTFSIPPLNFGNDTTIIPLLQEAALGQLKVPSTFQKTNHTQ